MGARYFSGVPPSQIQGRQPASTFDKAYRAVVSLSAYAFLAWFSYSYLGYSFREKYADWKAEKKVQARLEKLESKKHESAEAYLVVLEREVNALKAELFDRPADIWKNMGFLKRKSDMLRVHINKREIDALKEEVNSWGEGGVRGIDIGRPGKASSG